MRSAHNAAGAAGHLVTAAGVTIRGSRRFPFTIAMSIDEHWASVEALLKKYADRPISLADACLIRCAELHQEERILTFDGDFAVYKWARTRKFEPL